MQYCSKETDKKLLADPTRIPRTDRISNHKLSPTSGTTGMASTGAADGGEARDPPTGPRGDGHRGRGRGRGGRGRGRGDGARGRGRGRGGGGGGAHHQSTQHPPPAANEQTTEETKPKLQNFKVKNDTQDEGADGDVEVCFICANPITHYSVAPCTHITCHICALRLRALYKSKDCPHCRVSTPPGFSQEP